MIVVQRNQEVGVQKVGATEAVATEVANAKVARTKTADAGYDDIITFDKLI